MKVLLIGSNRLDKLIGPLSSIGITCVHKNDYASRSSDLNAVVTDIPGTSLLKGSYLSSRYDCGLIYRMRGDYWQEIRTNSHFTGVRTVLANNVLFRLCDAICTPDAFLQKKVRTETNFAGDITSISIPKDVSDFPPVKHTNTSRNILTLTNFDYKEKIEPLYEFLDAAEAALMDYDATWYIAGNGEFATEFRRRVVDYDHVEYAGFVEPIKYLRSSAVLVHISGFDIAIPNAILEGMAAALPVIVNDHEPFLENKRAKVVNTPAEFRNEIEKLLNDPHLRSRIGEENRDYVRRNHSPEKIGEEFRNVISSVSSNS